MNNMTLKDQNAPQLEEEKAEGGVQHMDSEQLFGLIFGSDKFDRYVGELSMQSEMTAAMGMEEDGGGMEALPGFLGGGGNDQKQRKRVAGCALELAEKLQPLIGVTAFTNELGESGGGQPSMTVEEFIKAQVRGVPSSLSGLAANGGRRNSLA